LILAAQFAMAVVAVGCGPAEEPLPTVDELESLLGDSLPEGARIVGGRAGTLAKSGPGGEADQPHPRTWLWIVASDKPLPLPSESVGRSARGRELPPRGGSDDFHSASFPVSAIRNLLAACEISEQDWPNFTTSTGIAYQWATPEAQIGIREAETETGWLTVIEAVTGVSDSGAPARPESS
jgi:hypothetical protein